MSAIEERLTALERRANRYRNTAVMIVVLVLSVGVGAAHTMSLIFKALQVFIGHAAAALLHVCTSAARCVSRLTGWEYVSKSPIHDNPELSLHLNRLQAQDGNGVLRQS